MKQPKSTIRSVLSVSVQARPISQEAQQAKRRGLFRFLQVFFFSGLLLWSCTSELPEEETLLQLLAVLSADLSTPSLIALTNQGLYYFSESAQQFVAISGLPASGITSFSTAGKNFIVGTTDGLFVSRHYGYDFARAPFPLDHASIIDVSVDPISGELSAITSSFYYHSTDGGRSFVQKAGLSSTPVSLSASNKKIIVCTTATGSNQVYISSDRGTTFTNIGAAGAANCNRILNVPNLSTGVSSILVSTTSGIYVSNNEGSSWTGPLTSGLPGSNVTALYVTREGTFYAAIGGASGGVAKADKTAFPNFSGTGLTSANILDVIAFQSTILACSPSGLYISENAGLSFLGPLNGLSNFFSPASCSRLGLGYVSIKTVGFAL